MDFETFTFWNSTRPFPPAENWFPANAGQPTAHERKVKVFLPKRVRQKDFLGLLWMNMLPLRLRGNVRQDCRCQQGILNISS